MIRKTAAVFLIVLSGVSLSVEKYIKVASSYANIRSKPTKYSTKVAVAQKDDIYIYQGMVDSWVQVFMFSGEPRFIYNKLVRPVQYTPELPKDDVVKRVFKALYYVEGLSKKHAKEQAKSGDDQEKIIQRQRLLDDKYKLEVCHKYGVQPALYNHITNMGVEKGWYR